ncbi:MAG TPA: tRNA pseudouridine(38-40) synthase TruA [bacterium]|nr:tRNA pseudouridine(38-40) synthase TruA [bacterium]
MHSPDPSDSAPDAHADQPTSHEPATPLQNYALLLAYNGSGYQGWQIQPHGPSVQGALEDALHTITRRTVKVYGSGRTDAGVHALNQVANVRLPPGQDLHKLRASLNGLLGPSVSVKAVVPVAERFHARHSARGKHYRYQLFNRPFPPVFGRHRAWWIKLPLDVPAMRAAAAHLIGEHDFSAFRAKQCAARHPVRTLHRLELLERDWPGCTLSIELEANGFLQHMARIVTGTLVEVGLGKLPPEAVERILAGRQREQAPATAPPGGLHLLRVYYDLAEFPELRAFTEA